MHRRPTRLWCGNTQVFYWQLSLIKIIKTSKAMFCKHDARLDLNTSSWGGVSNQISQYLEDVHPLQGFRVPRVRRPTSKTVSRRKPPGCKQYYVRPRLKYRWHTCQPLMGKNIRMKQCFLSNVGGAWGSPSSSQRPTTYSGGGI